MRRGKNEDEKKTAVVNILANELFFDEVCKNHGMALVRGRGRFAN